MGIIRELPTENADQHTAAVEDWEHVTLFARPLLQLPKIRGAATAIDQAQVQTASTTPQTASWAKKQHLQEIDFVRQMSVNSPRRMGQEFLTTMTILTRLTSCCRPKPCHGSTQRRQGRAAQKGPAPALQSSSL